NELPCRILCHRFETRSFPISLVACPRDFAFYVADPISSIHRSLQINWTRSNQNQICGESTTRSIVCSTIRVHSWLQLDLGPTRVRIQGGKISGITSRLFRRKTGKSLSAVIAPCGG